MKEGKREPIVGEPVTTPEGSGLVITVSSFGDLPPKEQKKLATSLRAKLGDGYAKLFYWVTVEMDGDVETFPIWDVEYDSDRDPEDAPWREHKPDS